MEFQDIIYEVENHTATITINRPEVYNAFRYRTVVELIEALYDAGYDKDIGSIVLTGAGEKAFCTGGDQKNHDGQYQGGNRGTVGMPVEQLHAAIRDMPKPVIAKVRGYAIGGGNVLATLCDLTLAADTAIFGQVGPKMGSVDPGYGTALLARCVGEKKAREIWYLCRRYSAQEACDMGLVNKVVPAAELDAEVRRWCDEINEKSPTAIALAKTSFNADSENIKGIGGLAFQALRLYYGTEESKEGVTALNEKRKPDFRKHVK
ncbi:enoyl-CoA hydratase-related protein [Minwuia thermotolerans]|uniref:1,4-dihydroxy-2-naphthoyl-CoA synthase n=1 Tax=Minwuia thermotolerans TaxID=2056226 RepID=A0A2M9G092_9PROT|nr:enoyl-CoA hydratase-related protein [Minwuia thermotolerans]PJK29094.1 1,4-dihydroxy-2-naphthoyl-CoA synthase [Minwuia thermotolerans]